MPELNPVFLNKSLITDVDFITDNTGGGTSDAIRLRLFDRDTDLLYRSIGKSTGDRIVTIDFGAPVNVDTIFIQNHNMEDFKIESDGPALVQVDPPGGPANVDITGNVDKNSYFEILPVTTQTIIITCHEIFGAVSGELELGEVYIGTQRFRMSDDTAGDVDPVPGVQQSIISLSDGTSEKLFIRRTVNYEINLVGVSITEREKYREIYSLNKSQSFAFVPRPAISHSGFAPNNVWLGLGSHYNWVNEEDIHEFTDVVAQTFNVNVDLGQAGGLD